MFKLIIGFYILLYSSVYAGFIRNNSDQVIIDTSTQIIWLDTDVINTAKDWNTSINNCENLSLTINNTTLNNWRIPTINELRTILDYSLSSPAFDTTYFNRDPSNGNERVYFSSTTLTNETSYAICIDFHHGIIESCEKAQSKYYRCITNR